MNLKFYKFSGTGNDFTVIDNRKNIVQKRAALAIAMCDRK